MTEPATIVDAPARPPVAPIEADEAPVTVVVEDDLSDALEPIDGPGQSAVVTLPRARIDALVSPPARPASTPLESTVPFLAFAWSTLLTHVVESLHPEALRGLVAPLAAEVVAGTLTRDSAKKLIVTGLDQFFDFKTMIPGTFGIKLEDADAADFEKVADWLLNLHTNDLFHGPAANAAKPANFAQWTERLFAPAKYAAQHPAPPSAPPVPAP